VILDLPLLQQSLDNITDYLTDSFPAASGRTFSSICHRTALSTSNLNRPVSSSKVNLSHPVTSISLDSTPCFVTESTSPRSKTLTLTFAAGNRDDFVSSIAHQAKFAADATGVKFMVENRQTETIGQMKSGKWVAYAVRALVLRFWDLAKVGSFLCLPNGAF
jgi:hydroxymethylglutaryl-CoA reductase (NADPH)